MGKRRPGAASLPIRTICALTGVNPVTLRSWERRYGLIRAPRTPKGHRLYSHDHVEEIRRILSLVEQGIPIGQVYRHLEAPAAVTGHATAWHYYVERMAGAIARFDEAELDLVYDEALSVHPIGVVTREVLVPLLARLGERWKTICGAVAEEHFYATYLRSKLGSRLQHGLRRPAPIRVLAACAPGELHDLGLLLFALEAHDAGIQVVVLGADVPFAEVAAAHVRARCDAVAISCTMDPEPGVLESGLALLVRKVGVPVFVGGPAAGTHRRTIRANGAVALDVALEDAVRLVFSAASANKAMSSKA